MTRAAIYARISTSDRRQNLQNQIAACERYIIMLDRKHWPWKHTHTYTDSESGASDKRPGLKKLLRDAALGKFDVVVVFDLSRLTRGGPAQAFEYIDRLNKSGVEFHSANEPQFRTDGSAGAMFVAIAAHIAAEERRNLQLRVKAGMERARAEGKKIGRPRATVDRKQVHKMIQAGMSLRKIAADLKVSPATVMRAK